MIARFAGRYELLRRLGAGGMGEVFLARDLVTRGECALKRLTLEVGAVAEARREFEVLSRIRHPSVISVHEFGVSPEGAAYYTMEFFPGLPADRVLVPGDVPSLAVVAAEVAHGLEVLHRGGVVHGDLKPSNLLVAPGGDADPLPRAVRLVDFGLASVLGGGAGHRGTAGFAAPEVVRGEVAGPSADLYALGATLYLLAAGRPPFEEASIDAVLRRQQAGPPDGRRLEEAGAPPSLRRLILHLMAPPGERPSDAREVRRELEALFPAARRPLSARLEQERLVGRERELAHIEQRLARLDRRSWLVAIAGVPGSGKSLLARELETRLRLSDRTVFRLSVTPHGEPGAAAAALLRRLALELGPGRDGAATKSGPDAGDFESQLQSARSWLGVDRMRKGPPAIVIDDSDQLDPLSRERIRRLVLMPDGPPVLWVWTRGSATKPEDERMLVEAGAAEVLELSSLNRAEVVDFAAARIGERPPEVLADFLWERAQGHPGFTLDLLRRAVEHGALHETEAGWIAEAARLAALPLGADFESSLELAFRSLGEASRRGLAALAALGGASDAERIRAVAGQDASLEPAAAAGLCARDAQGEWRLRSPALGPLVLEWTGEERRHELHRVAASLPGLSPIERFRHLKEAGDVPAALAAADAAFAQAPEGSVAESAASLAEAHDLVHAAAWHERAARALASSGRYQAAAAHLERALAMDPAGPPRMERLLLLSTAYLRTGMPAEVERVIRQALEEDPSPALHSRLLSNEGARLQTMQDPERASLVAAEALALAERSGDAEAEGIAAQTFAVGALMMGRLDDAERMAARAQQRMAQAGTLHLRVRALACGATVALARGQASRAIKLQREALDLARDAKARPAIEEALNGLSRMLTMTGGWAEARACSEEAARLALEDQRPRGAAVAFQNLAATDGLSGRPGAAARRAAAAIRLSRAHALWLEAAALRALGVARRIRGRSTRAGKAIGRGLERAQAGLAEEENWCRIEYGRVFSAMGRWKEAAEIWEGGTPRSGGSWERAVLEILSGRAAVRRNDLDAAQARFEAARQRLTGMETPYAHAMAEQLGAEIALVRGRFAETAAAMERALAGFQALPAPADTASAMLDLSELALSGRRARGLPVGAWLEKAAGTFERLGDRANRERALSLLVAWLRQSASPAATGGRDRDLIEAVSRLLHSLSDLRELSQRAMQMVMEQLEAERGVLLLADPDSGRLVPMAEFGPVDAPTRKDALGYSRRVVERVTESGGSLLIGDAPANPGQLSESMMDLRLRSILCVPLFVGGKVVGAVYLDDSRRPEAFGDHDRALMEGFAHLMAVAIEKSRGEEEVRRANEILVGENLSLRQEAVSRFQPQGLIGVSQAMQRVRAAIERAALTNTTVLLTGENGTGKELIARILHRAGKRRLKPFVAVNCGALPESLLETELFGILPNVATGVRGRDGRFQQADGGSLFLDEVGDMPLKQQVALLSAIANREITPVGGGKPVHVDVRIIAATNRDLRRMVNEGSFREDLFYRLAVIPIEVPPLRERKADIPNLAQHFVEHFAQAQERSVPELSDEFLAALMQSDWPGNVRELQNYIERVMAMTSADVLVPTPPPRDLDERDRARTREWRPSREGGLTDAVEEFERRIVEEALERAQGNQSLAARQLGIPEQAIRYRIKKYGLIASRQNRRIRRQWR